MNTLEVDRFRADGVPVRLRRTTAPPRRPVNVSYSVTAFIGDQRQLLSRTGFRATDHPETVDVIDGRMIVVHPDLRRAPKHGSRADTACRCRFHLVLNYLATWRLELLKNGLAHRAKPLAVREEFVSYLLNYKLDTLQEEIPQGAMRKFLDEWSHRWI